MIKKEYKFSVVMPIYNVEKYLQEAIESVINQTIGFKNNIQLILVNDGSKDNSENICLEYEKMYPDNIKYVKQENRGVSAARNNGMQYAEGKYINFLDSDDKWSLDAFKTVYDFFEKYQNKVDVVVCRMKFFEKREDYHLLDYKFERTKVVNIFEDYNYSHLHITSSFVKTDIAKKFKFNEEQKYGEDTTYINSIILEKNRYGVIREAEHFYRKRNDISSAVQTKDTKPIWYTTTIRQYYKYLMELSTKKFGYVIPYIQYLIAYDIQFRIKPMISKNISTNEREEYLEELRNVVKNIEDYIINEQRDISVEHKKYLFFLKYNKDITEELTYRKGSLYYKNLEFYKIRKNSFIIRVDLLDIKDGKIIMEGRVFETIPRNDFEIYLYINSNDKIKLDLKEGKESLYNNNSFVMDGTRISKIYTFKTEIILDKVKKISFLFEYKNHVENRLTIRFGRFSKIQNKISSFYVSGKYIITANNRDIKIWKNTLLNRIKKRIRFNIKLLSKKKYAVLIYRTTYHIVKRFHKKEIWLVSDREKVANDNGEHFFKYLQNVKNNKIKTYFVIDKKCPDYARMKKIGKVLDLNSVRYKIYFLISSKIVSSQANDWVINPFGKKRLYYNDIIKSKFIFLQHGIIKDDLSKWLKKYDKNISIFVTSAKPEYDSIVNGDYYYTSDEIKLTGLPRYDKLVNDVKKKILILPTHRRELAEWNPANRMDGSYNPYFKDSVFYKFYNKLINDVRILDALKKYNYKMQFAMHPLLQKQTVDFDSNEFVDIINGTINYQKEFAENALLITDYSSIAFDFSALRKPVLYTQFDIEAFFEGQVYDKGYFDYERDGFGPVCFDYETTVKEIIKFIENDCKLDDKYLQRMNNFYAFNDKNNCKRVYDEIIKL